MPEDTAKVVSAGQAGSLRGEPAVLHPDFGLQASRTVRQPRSVTLTLTLSNSAPPAPCLSRGLRRERRARCHRERAQSGQRASRLRGSGVWRGGRRARVPEGDGGTRGPGWELRSRGCPPPAAPPAPRGAHSSTTGFHGMS